MVLIFFHILFGEIVDFLSWKLTSLQNQHNIIEIGAKLSYKLMYNSIFPLYYSINVVPKKMRKIVWNIR